MTRAREATDDELEDEIYASELKLAKKQEAEAKQALKLDRRTIERLITRFDREWRVNSETEPTFIARRTLLSFLADRKSVSREMASFSFVVLRDFLKKGVVIPRKFLIDQYLDTLAKRQAGQGCPGYKALFWTLRVALYNPGISLSPIALEFVGKTPTWKPKT